MTAGFTPTLMVEDKGNMARFLARYWLGLVALTALIVVGFVMFRQQPAIGAVADTSNRGGSSISGPGDWAMEGYDPARTRSVDTTITLPITAKRELRVVTKTDAGSPVAISNNIMLIEADHFLRAVDLRTGKERWAIPDTGQYLSPAIAGNTVFIRSETGNEGQIFALDLRTGAQIWAFRPRRISSAAVGFFAGHISSPVIVDGLVFVGAGKELYALNATTGAIQWEYSAKDYVVSSATVSDGRVFISDESNLYAVNQQTGKLAWKAPATFSVYFSPIVAADSVFFTNGQALIALNATTGARRWAADFSEQTLLPGAVQGSRLFVKTTTSLHALDTMTGEQLWEYKHPNFVSLPVVAGDQLFAIVGASGQTQLAAFDTATGREVWSQAVASLASAAPIIAGRTLYARTTDGRVIGFSN